MQYFLRTMFFVSCLLPMTGVCGRTYGGDTDAAEKHAKLANLQHAIIISDLSPVHEGKVGSLNPKLSASIHHRDGKMMDITFASDASGEWKEIGSFKQAPNGTYSVIPKEMTRRGMTYNWKVSATDGTNTAQTQATFNLVYFFGDGRQIILVADCHKYGYLKHGWEKGKVFVSVQRGMWASYDIDNGWDRTFQRLFRETGNKKSEYTPNTLDDGGYSIGHTFWGYWDGTYHMLGIAGGVAEWLGAESRTFEGFQKLVENGAIKKYCAHNAGIPDGSSHTFSEDRAWIMAIVSDAAHQKGDAKYWQWSKQGGWKEPVTIGTLAPPKADHLALVRHTRDIWYLYLVEGDYVYATPECKSTLKYFKSTDGGKTWGPLQDTGLPAHTVRSHPSFARYGDNYYVFLSMDNNTVVYYSKDAEKWDKGNGRVVATGMSMKPHGTLLHQNALIFTVNPNRLYLEEQYGIITLIPELVSSPDAPREPSLANQAVLPKGTTETELSVKTHGPQTYDVAFYWDDGRYIGEDKLLREGDTARIRVAGLESGRTYRWYAVCRGALLEYYGCEPDTTSDEKWSEVFSFSIGK